MTAKIRNFGKDSVIKFQLGNTCIETKMAVKQSVRMLRVEIFVTVFFAHRTACTNL